MSSPDHPEDPRRGHDSDFEQAQAGEAPRAPRHARLRRPNRLELHLESVLEDTGYELRRKIGSGGMGIVYLARDGNGADVALKVLRPEIADDPRARARLSREVQALQKMRSDNIAQVVDAELDSPDAFVVTEFIPGPTLEDAVRTHGGLHLEAVREIGVVLGETLEFIHEQGILHRDLKPSNIMLRHATSDDLTTFDLNAQRLDPVIIDFGIAQAAEDSRLTSTGMMMGTAAYLDPEVVKSNEAGPGADWWAWAALIAYCATGREPFGSGRADIVFLRADRGDIDVEGLPTELQAWLRQALDADPTKRGEPAEMIERLARMDLENYAPDAGTATEPKPDETKAPLAMPPAPPDVIDPLGPTATKPLDRTRLLEARQAHEPHSHESAAQDGDELTEQLPGITSEPATQRMPTLHDEAPTRPMPAVPDPQGGYGTPITQPPAFTGHAQHEGALHPVSSPAHAYAPYPHPGPPMPHPQPLPLPPENRAAPRRGWLIALGAALLIGVGAIAPLTALILFTLLVAFARTWQRTWVASTRARERGVRVSSTQASAFGMAAPRYLWALIETVLLLLFPIALALTLIVATDAILVWGFRITVPLPLYGAAFMAVIAGLMWVGVSSRTIRYGSHRLVASATPTWGWSVVLAFLLLALVGAVAVTIAARSGTIDYFPYLGSFRFEHIAPWRR